jgi:membrane protein implicated in regulation of membrane protease activity
MLQDFIDQVGDWVWIIGGMLLLGLEILASGTFFLWFGISAIVVGVVALLTDISWQFQVGIFAVLAVILLVVGRRYFKNRRQDAPEVIVNERASQLIGSTYVLTQPIINGTGRIRVGDTTWMVRGSDLPSGARVKVVAVDGSRLHVEAA